MGSFINLNTLELIKFVKTSEFINKPDHKPLKSVRFPDGVELPDCDPVYWKRVGDDVVEMNATEKGVVDQARADEIAQAEQDAKDITKDKDKMRLAIAVAFLDEINILRTELSLPLRTMDDLKTVVGTKYDEIV